MRTSPFGVHDAPWQRPLREVLRALSAPYWGRPAPAGHSVLIAGRAVDEAQEAFSRALNTPHSHGIRPVLLSRAAALLDSAALVGREYQGRDREPRVPLGAASAERLRRDERDVLAGECTYALSGDVAARNVEGAHTALALIKTSAEDRPTLQLRILHGAAIELAGLLVRAAGNLGAEGRAGDSTHHCPPQVNHALQDLVLQIREHADSVENNRGGNVDLCAEQLSAARNLVRGVRCVGSPDDPHLEPPDVGACEPTRAAWWTLVAHEYAAATALDEHVVHTTYERHVDGLDSALVGGAAYVLCGSRLLRRPFSFRICGAWARQDAALSHAQESYVIARGGNDAAFAHTQRVIVSRLTRAVAALCLLDLRQEPARGRSQMIAAR